MKKTALALALAACFALPFSAHAAGPERMLPRITVTGEGQATMVPDIAILTIAVMREAKTARDALTANNDAMAAVIAAMKSSGIAERDLQTTGIQINPRYEYPQKADGGQEAVLAAYQVTNTLSVRIRDIEKTGEILDKSVSLGVNQGGDISFSNENPAQAREEARKKAVADAIAKAKTLAEAAGVSLGNVLEISETSPVSPPIPMVQAKFRADAAGAPVQAGENSYVVQVNMTYELR
ncbi:MULTISPECIES: SIMPL domain-containing protein [Mesorhizobium]|uniref:SIMPL domain-containing protein n=1 Tax=Mesorhizobium denitrificans TaxID=2294114 RepID=A0A371XEC4_9HYPH|nr:MULTISPECIES: SIMPL domain-containing protein [Mesorhizobium]RFC67566.1 SIMPL domain-containing protein [Mesorhizobium denitrificans]